MIRTSILRNIRSLYEISFRYKSEPILNIEKLEQDTTSGLDVVDEEAKKREDEIQYKRNKSRLRVAHRNILHDRLPYKEPKLWVHGTLIYSRKMYGQYGSSSGIDPSYCWPTQEELSKKMDYDQVAFPYTIPETIEEAKLKRIEKEETIKARQQDVVNKIKKLDQWKQELRSKITLKETEALLAKQRKDRLIEEVRRHFGYTVDPREEKFKEMLEKKEKEQKKASKEARKKEKEARMIAGLLSKKTEDVKQKPEKEAVSKSTTDVS